MGIFDRTAAALGFTKLTADQAAVDPEAEAEPSRLESIALQELFGLGDGLAVNRESAMQLDVISKVRNVVAQQGSRLPLHDEKNRTRNTRPRNILTQPDPAVPLATTLAWTLDHLLFYPSTEWVVLARDAYGFPAQARHVLEKDAGRDTDGNLVKAWGEKVDPRDVIRFDSPLAGGLLAHGRDAIRRAMIVARAASLAEDNPVPSFELHNEGDDLEPDEIDAALETWMAGRRKHGVGYTSKGIKAIPHGLRLEQLLIEGQKRADLMLVRKIGAPAWVADVAVEGASLTYNNRASRNWELFDLLLSPYLAAITGRLSLGDVTPGGWLVKADTDELTRDDMKTRFETYAIGIAGGFITQEQIDAWEGWEK